MAGAIAASAPPASAYSVLAHEANVDAVWKDAIGPLLAARFPRASREEIERARAYAYGGALIQDLGYYPFGSRFFSNLLHYVRSGDFVAALADEARDVDELAFAIGALSHYAADNTGHAVAVNRAVPLVFPKLQAKYGDVVTYAESPARHVQIEFSFDIVQTAIGLYPSAAYHDFIGFEVSRPVLERAFRRVYGLELKQVFGDEELAIATYRHAVSEVIPELTRAAWRDKREEILEALPEASAQSFLFQMTRAEYEHDFGASYRKPGWFTRLVTFVLKVIPKIGPLQPLKFEAPTPEAEALFVRSFKETNERYRGMLASLRAGRLHPGNTDFDTGRPSMSGEYPLADETYAELVNRLARDRFAAAPAELRQNILAFYAAAMSPAEHQLKRTKRLQEQLAALHRVGE
jgi:hypothetical protein